MHSSSVYFSILVACLLLCLAFTLYTFTAIQGEEWGVPLVGVEEVVSTRQQLLAREYDYVQCESSSRGGGELRSGAVADDYCDCPQNGLDEVLTSACSYFTVGKASFDCGDGSVFVFASRVGDGVMDCPDGSDESQSSPQKTPRSTERILPSVRRSFRHTSHR